LIKKTKQHLLSPFQVPNPFGLALKSPNLGTFCIGEGDKLGSGSIETGEGLNTGRAGEKLPPSLSDHDGAR
jgi:hypothetical protein